MEGLISVIVPVYNAEEYLSDCLCSLIRQTCRELGASRETVSSALIRRFSISGEEAEGYLERFWE